MKFQLHGITARELVAGCDDGEGGVVSYGGKLDIGSPIPAWGNLEVRYNCVSIMMYWISVEAAGGGTDPVGNWH